jgi:phenylacetate-CoA ligase
MSQTIERGATPLGSLEGAVAAARRAAPVRAYADEWDGVDADAIDASSFAELPFLTKAQLVSAVTPDDPYGGRLGVPRSEIHTAFVTPGPINLPLSRTDFDAVVVAQARSLASSGVRAEDVVDQTVGYQWVVGGTILHRSLEHIGCTVVPGGPGQTDLHIQSISALGVTAILAFPSFLDHVLERARELGVLLPLRLASIAGEMSEGDFKQRIEREYGVLVRERYGIAEGGPVAYECHVGAGLHLDDDVYVEFIDPDSGAPRAPDDPALKEIVVTAPLREAFPLVRFRTGDLVEALDVEPCECGSTSPRIRRVVGRASSIPRIKGMFIVPRQIEDVLRRNEVRGRFQLRFDRPERLDRLTVVVERTGVGNGGLDAVHTELMQVLRMRCELDVVDSIADDAPLVEDLRNLS